MLRLSFIFFFKISIGYNMNASKIMKSFAASVAKSKQKVLKTISAFLIAVKAELIWYILSHIYLAKNSDGQWSFWKLESTTGQLDCLKLKSLCSVGYVHTILGTKSSTLEIGATQLRCLFQKSRQLSPAPFSVMCQRKPYGIVFVPAQKVSCLV